MPKKFKIKQNLEKKYNGENLPIRVRQDDIGTIIESQIFTEENNPYDLTNCTVLFNLQPASGLPILGEQAVIKDATNGIINYSLSSKDTRKAGKTKAAFFTITNKDNSVTESTGDIDLTILPFPKILDSDYLKITSSFKGRKRLDRNSNPNEIWILNISPKDSTTSTFKSNPQEVETSDDVYELFNNPKEPFDKFKYVYTGVSFDLMYLFKIDPKTVKIRINNLYIGKSNGEDIPDEYSFANTKGIVSPIPQIYVANKMTGITDDVGNINGYGYKIFYNHSEKYLTPDLNLSGYKPLQNESIDNKTIYTNSFELDLTKNNFLTSDNYLMLTVHSHYIPWKEGSPFNGYQCICVSPQIECIQYYLPE